MVGEQGAGRPTEPVSKDEDVFRLEILFGFDEVPPEATLVNVHKVGIVSQFASSLMGNSGHDDGGVGIGDVVSILVSIKGRGPHSVFCLCVDSGVGEVCLEGGEGEILGAPVDGSWLLVLEIGEKGTTEADRASSVACKIDLEKREGRRRK